MYVYLGDYGDPSLNSQYQLIVNINDENDCAPKFTQLNYEFRIETSIAIGSFIGQVQANDDDYSSKFHSIQYKLSDQNIIDINPNNGSLFLLQQPSVDLEFNLTIRAIDQHNHSLYDQANIQILFYDKTKCFNQSIYVFNTTEHEIIPYQLGQIDLNNCFSISYNLIPDNSLFFPFSIEFDTGIINVIHELDREKNSFYKFYINSTIEIEIQINILDKNDHYPIFDNLHEQYIYIPIHHTENHQIFITNIHATDNDIDFNGQVHYYFTNKDFYNYFHLYSNGSIILYNTNNIHLPIRLEIYARDYGYPNVFNSKETIIIYICDLLKPNECSTNILRRNFYLGSIFLMISIVLFLFSLILYIFWKLFLKKENKKSYNCRIEAQKNLSKKITFFFNLKF